MLVNAASIIVSEETTSREVNLSAGESAKFATPYAVLTTVEVTKADGNLEKDVDYTVSYDDEGRKRPCCHSAERYHEKCNGKLQGSSNR